MAEGKLDYDEVIAQLTPEIYQNFKRAVEIGKWPDGRVVTPEQKEHCMTAVIAYEQKFVAEQERTGFIDRGSKEEGEMCDDKPDPNSETPLKWQ